MNDRAGSNVRAFFIGGLIGAGLALIFAPRSGKETREHLKEYVNDLEDKFKSQYAVAKKTATEEVDKIKRKTKAAVEKGKEAFREELDKKETDNI